jgi:hypothetical protein
MQENILRGSVLQEKLAAVREAGGEPTTDGRGTTGQRQTRGLIRDPRTHHPTRGTDTLAIWDPEIDYDISFCLAQSPKRRVGPSMRVTRPDPERLGSLPSETKETEEAHGRERERESVVVWGRDLRTEAFLSVYLLGNFFVLCFP